MPAKGTGGEKMNEKIKKVLCGQEGNHIFPFLWLHGETEETLREYMRIINESNIAAVCVESRPHPDFCGKQWWNDMDIILDEARKRKMKVWILDDSHFPTGYANGALENKPDSLCRQSICFRMYEAENGLFQMGPEEILHPKPFEKTFIENYTMEKEPRVFDDDRLLALFAVRYEKGKSRFGDAESYIDLMPHIREDCLRWRVPEGKWRVYVIHLSRNFGYHRSYINMMDRNSCRVLIDSVYEPHYRHYKDDFGTTIAGFFSDEPELGNGHMYEMNDPFGTLMDYPWSRELETELQKRLGEKYPAYMALLWESEADPDLTAEIRYAFMDSVTRLVKKDFSLQIGTWCRDHGVQYIGHLIEDNNHHTRTGSSLGHYFRGIAGQDMAGIDDIGGQVLPQGEDLPYDQNAIHPRNGVFYHYVLGRLGSSAAAADPLKNGNSMCEIYGNYGWEEGVRLEKYLTDHFLVRGINHFVPHAFSPKQFPDPDCPPHFYAHGHNPQFRHFGALMAYTNRVCELISGGKHTSPVAILYYAEGDWTGKHMTMDEIARQLTESQVGYDIIPQDVFAEPEYYHTFLKEGVLNVNTQEYSLLIVPYMQYVTKAFAAAVQKMKKYHILVLFAGGFPEGICDCGSKPESEELIRELTRCGKAVSIEKTAEEAAGFKNREITISPADSQIRYLRYIHDDGTEVFLFTNEGTKLYQGSVDFNRTEHCGQIIEYDAWDNRIFPAYMTGTSLLLNIEPLKCRIFIFDRSWRSEDAGKLSDGFLFETAEKEQIPFDKTFRRSICESIEYPHFAKEKETGIPDHLEEELPEFSGFVRYENEFTLKGKAKIWLEITDAREGVEVFVNDQTLGIQIVPVFRYELSDFLVQGKNRIRIETATTLERKMALVPDFLGRTKTAASLSGINGEIRLWKIKESDQGEEKI